MRQEYSVFAMGDDGFVVANPTDFLDWLLTPAEEGSKVGDRDDGRRIIERAKEAMDRRLGDLSTADLDPENKQLVSAAWCADR